MSSKQTFRLYVDIEAKPLHILFLRSALKRRPVWFKHFLREALERFLLSVFGVSGSFTVTSGLVSQANKATDTKQPDKKKLALERLKRGNHGKLSREA